MCCAGIAFGEKELENSGFTMRKYEILIVLLIGMIPLLWYIPGYAIARGDYFPYIFGIESLNNDFYLWSPNNSGNPSSLPAYALYGLLCAFLKFLTIDIGLWQIILRMIYFAGATFSMLYLAKTVYPKEDFAATVASIFYIFNFFIMSTLLNTGMMWTYAFLPLLIALFIKTLTQTQNTYRYIICFALTFTIVASISTINLADDALIFISLASVLPYYVVLDRKITIIQLIKNLLLLLIITFLLSLWWIIPILNYYLLSPSTQLQQEINVLAWSWTHARASFLNLFWLNGGWGWKPEYFAYYNTYSNNAVLTCLVFIPFLLASTATLFTDRKSKFNAYIMLTTLLFTFMAKGLHEPLSFVNLFLYNYIPYMNVFREPVSKFTLIMIPFLALLIGHTTDRIAKTLTHRGFKQSTICSNLFMISVILVFTISTFPILTNPIEAKTEQIPYSTYVKIPQYWYETSEWLSRKTGDFMILVTPLDDYYQVPYSWGYYGTDAFIERLIQKPVISPCSVYSYKVNPNIAVLINQLRDAMRYERKEEFETTISLLNVRYILQRNDLDYKYIASTNRDIVNPEEMRNFLSNQPNITLVKTFGELDIYEYTEAQHYIHIFEPKQHEEYNVEITNKTILALQWNFNSTNQLSEWKNTTLENQFDAICELYLDNGALRFELWDSTWGWKTIASPLITSQYEAKYNFRLDIKGENAHKVHIKILEFNKKMEITHVEYVFYVADGTFNWRNIQTNYVPKNENTTFLQFTIWNSHETHKPLPNLIWIDNVEIQGHITKLNTTKIQRTLKTSTKNPPAKIIEYEKPNPTRIIVKVNASKPFILAINEAYDPNWKAYLKREPYNSIQIFSVMNGFQINKTGQFEIVIQYEPQKWFYTGCAISLATLLICTVYLTYTYTKTKNISNKIRQKLEKLKTSMRNAEF